jgi:hypothetical protein
VTTALGWLALVGGALALCFPVVTWLRVRASRNWPHVAGRIVESAVERQLGGKGRPSYMPRIRYRYRVEGRDYVSSQVTFWGSVGGSQWLAERTTRRYPQGSAVTVYYNPEDPHDAVLDRAFSLVILVLPPAGLLFLGVGYALLQR